MPIKIITTEDGSHSLFDEELNETYHSTRGARGESMHVFICEGLEYFLSNNQTEEVRILEVGMGTGLNVFLTAIFAEQQKQKIHFTTLEPFPISEEVWKHLNYFSNDSEEKLLRQIHECIWEEEVEINPYFTLMKSTSKLETLSTVTQSNLNTSTFFNVIYFDAFAPSKQPEVWSLENLKKCNELMEKRGVLTTYCAQGQFKRNLKDAGFQVETLQGAMGKKEMVRGLR